MKYKRTIMFILLIYCCQCFAKESKSDSLIVFKNNKIYKYEAIFTDKNGLIVSKEIITLLPLGEPWLYQKSQTSFKLEYSYTSEDSITFLSYLNPKTKKPSKPVTYIWTKSIISGAVENDSTLWMHPFRENQYNYTEIAPFPRVDKTRLNLNREWLTGLNIMLGWGNFKGKLLNTYKVVGKENRKYGDLNLDDCWLIKAVGEHDKLGKSYLDFYYHPEYGFVEMNYTFYDGVKISFVLKSVIEKK
jgi:hypothetical protein